MIGNLCRLYGAACLAHDGLHVGARLASPATDCYSFRPVPPAVAAQTLPPAGRTVNINPAG